MATTSPIAIPSSYCCSPPASPQVAVPVLLVLLALWGGRASASLPQQPPLPLDR